MTGPVTYLTIADQAFFPGAVALLNSLRLTGNDGQFVVLDVGLDPAQRRLLEPHGSFLTLPPDATASPFLAKPFAHRLEARGTVVIVDSDMLVTRSLAGVVAGAEAGRISVYPDHPTTTARWFAEWSEGFGLEAPLRRQVYANAGFLALSLDRHRGLLERWWEACGQIPAGAHFSADPAGPYWAGDQDALNALLMSEIPAAEVELQPPDAEVYWDELRKVEIVDERTLECRRGGSAVTLLHYSYRPKPWQAASWPRIVDDAFVRLLPRVLFADDVPLRLDPAGFPPWARPGRGGRAAVRALSTGHRAFELAVEASPKPFKRRLHALRDGLTTWLMR
jgi:hypothetical protein